MTTIAFFNNKGCVGKTSLVYHVAWMMSELGVRVVVLDLDPQANVSSMFLSPEQMERLWEGDHAETVFGAMKPLMRGIGDLRVPRPIGITERLYLVPGDLALSEVEDRLSETWPQCLSGDERAFRVTTAFARIVAGAAEAVSADIALIDVGPNLGAINRSALVATEFVVIPLSADMFSIKGLENVGPSLRKWRADWVDRLGRAPKDMDVKLPTGLMNVIGYVVSRYSVFSGGPVQAFQKWLDRAPATYRNAVTGEATHEEISVEDDPYRLARLKDYRSLMPMAQEARKPMFLLKPADGAIGGHQTAVSECRKDFDVLTRKILHMVGTYLS